MQKTLVICGLILAVFGIVLGLYASQRNCLIAFMTRGEMNFWTVVEILGGLTVLAGIVTMVIGFIKKK